MAGLNNIREAYEQVYAQLDERMDDDAREMRRLAAAERRAGKSDRTDSKTASKYADSEAKSAAREDKKSKGKHIHGMADSVEMDGDLVDEAQQSFPFKRVAAQQEKARKASVYGKDTGNEPAPNVSAGEREATRRFSKMHQVSQKAKRAKQEEDKSRRSATFYRDTHPSSPAKMSKSQREEFEIDEAKDDSYLETNMNKRKKNNEKAVEDMKKTKAHADMVKAARRHFEEFVSEAKNKEGKEQGADGKACWKGYRYAGTKNGKDKCVKSEEFELDERALDATEKSEKERIVKGMKKSAANFKARYGKNAKSVMYATATARAKERMDTSKSDRRYGVER